jgi:AraC family transcriptional regulator
MTAVALVYSPGTCHDRVAAVGRAIECMQARLSDPQPLAELARAGLFSRFHFHRIFREVTSMTPARFLAALRMTEARRLLLHTRLTVSAISQYVGYHSLGTFTTQFTRLVGMSPGAFRTLARSLRDLPIARLLPAVRSLTRTANGWPVMAVCDAPPGNGLLMSGLCGAGDTGGHTDPSLCAAPERYLVVGGVATPGEYRLWAMLADARRTVTDVLVDRMAGSYLVGEARVHLPSASNQPAGEDGRRPAIPMMLRTPEPIDPPLLSASPLRMLADLATAPGAGPGRVNRCAPSLPCAPHSSGRRTPGWG